MDDLVIVRISGFRMSSLGGMEDARQTVGHALIRISGRISGLIYPVDRKLARAKK